MKLLLTACLVAAFATNAFAALLSLQEETIMPVSRYESENMEMDYNSLQYQMKQASEMEVDESRDDDFDNQLTDESDRPREPREGEVADIFEKNKDSVAKEAIANGIDVNKVTIKRDYSYMYYTNKAIWKPTLKCCPRVWKYGCRSTNQRMPCFVNYYNNAKEWCCPLWPGVYTARCLCDKCAIQTNTCIHQGRCLKRYSKKSFLAVCYRNGWGFLRFIKKWLPTSCFCSAKYSPYSVEGLKCTN